MKGKSLIVPTVIVSMALTAIAVNASPGDSNDPLVSKSYVDSRINEILTLSGNGTKGNVSTDYIDEITEEVLGRLEYVLNTSNDWKSTYTPVYAKFGQTIVGDEGSEIILRSGTGKGYCIDINGMVNMTTGAEIFDGDSVDINNLIIVPRGGRGVTVTSAEAWFIIRGGHSILN